MIHGRHFDEGTLFTLAYAYEQATMHRRPSPLFPECTDPTYVPLEDVYSVSSDVYNQAFAPVSQPGVAAAAGRKLLHAAADQPDQLTGTALGMAQHRQGNWRLNN